MPQYLKATLEAQKIKLKSRSIQATHLDHTWILTLCALNKKVMGEIFPKIVHEMHTTPFITHKKCSMGV